MVALSRFVNLSEGASLALHAMIIIAAAAAEPTSVGDAARRLGASEAHMAKIIQRLAKTGLVRTTRGPGGGVTLARAAEEITFLEIFEAIEGPLDTDSCMLSRGVCQFPACIFGSELAQATEKIKNKFANTRLADFKI